MSGSGHEKDDPPTDEAAVDAERLSEWRPIIWDFATCAVAVFVAIFGVTTIREPTLLGVALGFAATLFGVPAARRWDSSRRKNGGNRNEEDDRWSHLP